MTIKFLAAVAVLIFESAGESLAVARMNNNTASGGTNASNTGGRIVIGIGGE